MGECTCACKVWVELESSHIPMGERVHIYVHSYLYLTHRWYFPKCLHIHYLLKSFQQPGE